MLRTDDLNLLMSPLPSYPLTILCTFFSINFHSKSITMEIKTKKQPKKPTQLFLKWLLVTQTGFLLEN